jgi:DNA-binding LacI/PurR family transcriptional regulator
LGRIHDVAREAGVSITTVSHVFSGKRRVAPATEERVRAAADRLGYLPRSVARGLATGRSMTLAIAFPFEDNSLVLDPYFSRLLEGFSGAAAEGGYGFLLVPSSPRRSDFPLLQLVVEGRFDGAVVADPARSDDLIPILERHGVPVVTTGRYRDGQTVPWVDNDNCGGMAQLLEHVESSGYVRPALISMSRELSFARDIEAEFRRIAGHDAPIVRTGEVTEQAGYEQAVQLLDSDAPPDAIITSSDRQALGALRAAKELDIAVPQELGIAGAGDTLASHAHPPITSLHVQARSLGETAINWLLALIDGGETPAERILETHVVARRSTERHANLSVADPVSRGA